MNNQEIIISGVHMDLTPALKEMVQNKVSKLFQHEERIIRIRVELGAGTHKGNHQKEFSAKGHIEIHGPDMVVIEKSEDLYKSIDGMVIKLARKLRRRARLSRVKRKQHPELDIPASLPQVNIA